MKRALIVNAYATGNWGDAAIVEGMIQTLHEVGIGHVTVAPVDWKSGPASWLALGADDVVPPLLSLHDAPQAARVWRARLLLYAAARITRSRLPKTGTDLAIDAYRNADLVMSAGGAYLGGHKPGINLIKLANIQYAASIGQPAVVGPVTINPFSNLVGSLIRWGMKGAAVFVRDRQSAHLLTQIGILARLVPDLALRAPSLRKAAAMWRDGPVPGQGRIIGWAPRDYRKEHSAWGRPYFAEEVVLRSMKTLLRSSENQLRFVSHVRADKADDDSLAVDRLRRAFSATERSRIDNAARPDSLIDAVLQYQGLDILITSRLHAALFALAAGTPAIAVAYEPKVLGVMSDLGLADRVLRTDATLTESEVVDRIHRLLGEPERARTADAFRQAQVRFQPLDATLQGLLTAP